MNFGVHTYEAEGIRMRYFTAGQGRPLLFLHGGGVKAMTYLRNLELLAQRFFVIAPDIPPFGASSMPRTVWNFRDYASYFTKFLDHLAVTDVVVIGHSYGGGVGLCLAAQSTKVGKLVVVDAAGITQHPLRTFFYQYFIRKSIHNLNQDLWLFVRLHIDFVVNICRHFARLVHGIRLVFHAMSPRYQDTIGRIAVPTLILWGDRDEIFPASTAESLHAVIKGSELRIISGNHDWCLFHPEHLDHIMP